MMLALCRQKELEFVPPSFVIFMSSFLVLVVSCCRMVFLRLVCSVIRLSRLCFILVSSRRPIDYRVKTY